MSDVPSTFLPALHGLNDTVEPSQPIGYNVYRSVGGSIPSHSGTISNWSPMSTFSEEYRPDTVEGRREAVRRLLTNLSAHAENITNFQVTRNRDGSNTITVDWMEGLRR